MEDENICTVLVSSCDTYEDTWIPFFTLFKKYWPDCNYPIVLNTETKKFKMEGMDIKTFSFYKNSKVTWGKRLRRTLKSINSKYILFILDDFFLEDYVDQNKIQKCIDWMEKDKNIAVFSFMPAPGPNIESTKYNEFELRGKNAEYRFNCQAAIWRRDRLIEFVREHENPWEWEILGSKRSSRYTDEFYSLKNTAKKVFNYDLEHGGAIHRGKWVKEVVLPLTKANNLNINFSVRGFEEYDQFGNPIIIYSSKKKNLLSRVYNHIKYNTHKKLVNYKSLK